MRFLIVDEYTSNGIWDDFILRTMLTLKSKPKGWEGEDNKLPEGEWTVFHGMYSLASGSAYLRFGVSKPAFKELPVVFAVSPSGEVEKICKATADQAAEFINERI